MTEQKLTYFFLIAPFPHLCLLVPFDSVPKCQQMEIIPVVVFCTYQNTAKCNVHGATYTSVVVQSQSVSPGFLIHQDVYHDLFVCS